jgi:hypothetical protein
MTQEEVRKRDDKRSLLDSEAIYFYTAPPPLPELIRGLLNILYSINHGKVEILGNL